MELDNCGGKTAWYNRNMAQELRGLPAHVLAVRQTNELEPIEAGEFFIGASGARGVAVFRMQHLTGNAPPRPLIVTVEDGYEFVETEHGSWEPRKKV